MAPRPTASTSTPGGEYDDPAVLTDFTAAKGPKITVDSYGSNPPEMIAKLSAAKGTTGYDICVPTHSSVQQMATGGLLTELDHSKLPNMKNLTPPKVVNTTFDPGNKYSVCKDWGLDGLRVRHHRHQAQSDVLGGLPRRRAEGGVGKHVASRRPRRGRLHLLLGQRNRREHHRSRAHCGLPLLHPRQDRPRTCRPSSRRRTPRSPRPPGP